MLAATLDAVAGSATTVKSETIKNFTGKFLGKFVVKWILKIPPHLATLPCETLMSAKEAINKKFKRHLKFHLFQSAFTV